MATINSECCVLLEDGATCRREARYTCDNWHLVCASHRISDGARSSDEGCPICSSPIIQFSAIEEGLTSPRRRKSDFSRAIGNFLREAANRWFPEFNESPELVERNEANEEI